MAAGKKTRAKACPARLKALEELRLQVLEALESAAKSGGFRRSPGSFQGPIAVLQDTAQRIMRLMSFQAAALWLVNESTADFELGWCEPENRRDLMAAEFEQLTREGIIALALKDEGPVLAAGSTPQLRHLVQVLTTPSRVRGLLLAGFDQSDPIPDGVSPLVSIHCQSAAAALEGLELYRLLHEKNAELEAEVAARKAVQVRQELFAKAFESSLEGMLIIDASGKVLEANPSMHQLTGCTSGAMIGKNARTLLSRIGARRHFRTIIKEVLNHGRFKGEITGFDERGEPFHFWLSVNALRHDDGRVGHYVAVLHYMAGRKELERALVKAELKYREIFEHAPVAIFRTTMEGRVLDANPAYARILGYSSPEEILDAVSDIRSQLYVVAADRDRYLAALKEKGVVQDYEVWLRRKDGQEVLVSMNSRVVKDASERLVSLDGFMRDVTAARKAEKEQERLQKQLHQIQKLESVGRLAGGVAHDFNNMLGVILGQVQLAMMKVNSQDPLQDRLLEIEKAAQRSANLVSQLLAFARKQTVLPRTLNLNEVIVASLNMLERLMGENITLAWKPHDRLWPVMMDPSQVEQILVNLVVNAKDAIAGSGTVTIATDNRTLDEAFCQDLEDLLPGDHVLLTVEDTGCGMDRKTLDQIFEPFFTTKDFGQGTGLGLATVYGIVRQNRGLITVISRPGQGSTFSVFLPRVGPVGQCLQQPGQKSSVRGPGTGILVVEDDPDLLHGIRETLENLGHAPCVASNPWEAVRQAQQQDRDIQLLITDVAMPEMNGQDLARRLKTLIPGLKCIFMSGCALDLTAGLDALDEGLHVLHKPFTMDELAEVISKALG